MSRLKHTPGPWQVGVENMQERCIAVEWLNRQPGHPGHLYEICVVNHCDGSLPGTCGEGNANLIAAAPDLLDSLELLIAAMENVLLHQGDQMTPADRDGRTALVSRANEIVQRATSF